MQLNVGVMCTEATEELDAIALRDKCYELSKIQNLKFESFYGSVTPGKYQTQKGSFEIKFGAMTIGVCVWEHGQVEIISLDKSGKEIEIETLEKATLENAAQSVIEHIGRHT